VSLRTEGQLAVAAVLPPGYLRTWLPAYEASSGAPVLPLYGYAAVGAVDGEPRVAALRTDRWEAWNPQAMERQQMAPSLRAAVRALPANRLVQHLVTCATDYRCLTAQNLFIRRGEGAIPVSPACNAACLGCISEQWGEVASPQTRLSFAPGAIEIAELAAWHLSAHVENFVSFGQGCEGEPLTRGAILVEAVRRIRAAAPAATIHINSNGSRPEVLRRLIAAGLNSIRISIFSLDDARFRAYYRPVGYSLKEVADCATVMADRGGQVTVNLLTFPGISDAPEEIEALVTFIQQRGVHVCLHVPRGDGIEIDAPAGPLVAQRLGQLSDATLARGVRDHVEPALKAQERGQVHDLALTDVRAWVGRRVGRAGTLRAS